MRTKYNDGKYLLSIMLVILLLMLYPSALSVVNSVIYNEKNNYSNINYISLDQIIIENDADFITYGFPGNGSAINPYRIENFHISDAYEGISIMTTTVYFIIQNCLIEGSITGIYLVSIAPNTIQIINNSVNKNEVGIYLYNSDNAVIANNTFINNKWGGVLIEYSFSAVIANNRFAIVGIEFGYDYDFSGLVTFQVYNNTLNGKPLLWLTSETSQIVSASIYSQIFLVDCSSITVKHQIIRTPKKGIRLFYCDDVHVENNSCGIEITSSDNVDITNNKFDGRNIEVFSSTNILIEKNIYDKGYFVIYIKEYSNNIIIRDNYCKSHSFGIYIEESSDCLIEENICENNREYSIYLPSADQITIRNNIIKDCRIHGIYLFETSNCEIYQNVIYNSLQYGISLDGDVSTSVSNEIYRNIFIDNNQGGTQALDNGVGNIWYNTITEKGNYWNDWSGITEYPISGTAANSDPYPLADSDDDGMSPEWELDNGLDLWNNDSAEDPDNDDLTNIEEFNIGTNPRNNDSDGDGYLDGEEVEQGYDPLDPENPKKAVYEFFIILAAIGVVSLLMKKKK